MFQWTNAWIGAKIHILLPTHRRRRPILHCHPIHPNQFYGVPSDHANAPADAQFRNKEQCCDHFTDEVQPLIVIIIYIVLVLLNFFSLEPVNRLETNKKR